MWSHKMILIANCNETKTSDFIFIEQNQWEKRIGEYPFDGHFYGCIPKNGPICVRSLRVKNLSVQLRLNTLNRNNIHILIDLILNKAYNIPFLLAPQKIWRSLFRKIVNFERKFGTFESMKSNAKEFSIHSNLFLENNTRFNGKDTFESNRYSTCIIIV